MDVKVEQPRQQHVDLAGRILSAAIDMGLTAGSRLPEQALAERCNVSRTPIRKALAILAGQGAALTSPDGGFVLAGDPASLRDKVAALPASGEEALIEAILGDLAQRRIGESQTVVSLQRRYGVERAMVQNALIKLTSDQLAERAPGQQWLLKATVVTDEAVAQSFYFRMLMEPAALTAPGFRHDPAALSALRHLMEGLAAADERSFDTEAFERSDHDFHAMIARCCGNAVIGEALLNHHRRRRSARLHSSISVFRLIQSTREHLAIVERIDAYVAPTWDAIVDTAARAEAPLRALLTRLKPAAIVLDNVVMFPAIARSGVPWIRVVSCAETELPDHRIPPYLSGLPAADRTHWHEFSRRYAEAVRPAHRRLNALLEDGGLDGYPDGEFLEASPHLNLLLAPEIVRHARSEPLDPERFVFLEGCVRREGPYRLPAFAAHGDAPLVYTAFGSLGAMDTELIGRMIELFATMPYRFLVNVGAWRESYRRVPDNVFLDSWFPQPSVVAQSSLFIHHGGNNSFCEALYYCVPSVVMPYCWDGHDNAQRAVETGTGCRLDRYGWTEPELRKAIGETLASPTIKSRLAESARKMQAAEGARRAAAEILKLV